MREVIRGHNRENISNYVIEVIKEYGINNNLRYIVIDNALDNDTIIVALLLLIRHEFKYFYDLTLYRIRY
jgi:hypothetical protein